MKTDSQLCSMLSEAMGMLSFPRATHIVHYLLQTWGIPGAVGEFGCHAGRTAVLMASLTDKPLYLYDSFKGLPPTCEHDKTSDVFHEGAMSISEDAVRSRFRFHGLSQPSIVSKFFNEIQDADLPEHFAFVHLDGDFYDSILSSLVHAYPRMSPGGIIIIDDFGWEELPGVIKAVNDYCIMERALRPIPLQGINGKPCYQALLKKPSWRRG